MIKALLLPDTQNEYTLERHLLNGSQWCYLGIYSTYLYKVTICYYITSLTNFGFSGFSTFK